MLVIGTSAFVHPAASLPLRAARTGSQNYRDQPRPDAFNVSLRTSRSRESRRNPAAIDNDFGIVSSSAAKKTGRNDRNKAENLFFEILRDERNRHEIRLLRRQGRIERGHDSWRAPRPRVPRARFKAKMAELKLPVRSRSRRPSGLICAALKSMSGSRKPRLRAGNGRTSQSLIKKSPFSRSSRARPGHLQKPFRGRSQSPRPPFRKTHLHEAGADDALVDVLGCCWLARGARTSANSTARRSTSAKAGSKPPTASFPFLLRPSPSFSKEVPVYSAHAQAGARDADRRGDRQDARQEIHPFSRADL